MDLRLWVLGLGMNYCRLECPTKDTLLLLQVTGEVAQWVKPLPPKPEHLSPSPQNPGNVRHTSVIPVLL